MIDGKGRERVLQWRRRHRGAFGIAEVREDEAQVPRGATVKGKEKSKGTGPDLDPDLTEAEGGESDSSPSSSSGSGSATDPGSDVSSSENRQGHRSGLAEA